MIVMGINYLIIIPILILVVLLVVFFAIKNRKDRARFEQQVNEMETRPENHEDDKI